MPDQTIRAERMAGIGRFVTGVVILGVAAALLMTAHNAFTLTIGWLGAAVGVLAALFGLVYAVWPPTLTLTDAALVFHGPFGMAQATPWREFGAFQAEENRGRRLVGYQLGAGKRQFLYGAWPVDASALAELLEARRTAAP
jgi:hypothetical protein